MSLKPLVEAVGSNIVIKWREESLRIMFHEDAGRHLLKSIHFHLFAARPNMNTGLYALRRVFFVLNLDEYTSLGTNKLTG
jgi:hypothetical protein